MGFLDRMVSDLIRDNTGINARRLVRRIGGGKLLALGGAALAASVLAEKKGVFGQGGARPAAPPPLPGTTAGASPPPVPPVPVASPPPVPGAVRSDAGEEADELPPEATCAVVRTMVAAALADGDLAPEEKAIIHRRLGESGLSEEQTRQIHQDLVLPPSPEDLASLTADPGARETLYRFAALVVLADEKASDLERRWLERLASAFGLGAERKAALEAEIFSPGDDA